MTQPTRRPSPLARIEELERRVNAALNRLELMTPGLGARMDEVEETAAQSHAEVSYLQSDVDGLKRSLAGLSDQESFDVQELNARCTRIETVLAHIEAGMASLTERVVKLEKNKR